MPHLYLLVPVLNEAENLPRLFEGLASVTDAWDPVFDVTVLLIDDGSTDGTGERARGLAGPLDLVVLTHETNKGPGRAFGTGFEHLAGRLEAADRVVTLEGDNTSRLELLRQMLRRSEEGYDVVLASPYMYGGAITATRPLRVLTSHLANAFVKQFLGIRGLLTISSFYRVHQGSLIIGLQQSYGPRILERAGFESMVEMLMKMIYLGATISEVPMVLDSSLRTGQSKMKVGRTARGYLSLLRKRRAWRAAAVSSGLEVAGP